MSMKTGKIIINAAIALLSVTLLFLSCEKSSLGGRDGLKGYWMSALIYTIMGSSIVISTNGSDDIEYLNYSDGNLSGYTKVSKR